MVSQLSLNVLLDKTSNFLDEEIKIRINIKLVMRNK